MKLLLRVILLLVFFLFLEGPLDEFIVDVFSGFHAHAPLWVSVSLKIAVLVIGLKFTDKISR